jgi:hypothetical protein
VTRRIHAHNHRASVLLRAAPTYRNFTIIWHSVNINPKAGGQTLRGRLQHRDRSRYVPHQGAQEMTRRRSKTTS